MTIKVFTDPSMTRDAYPDMKIGETRNVVRNDHLLLVTATDQLGCDTGRRRYRVVCRSCHVVVHPGTTGPRYMIDYHEREVLEMGKAEPYPGEEYSE